ncbi:MAG: DUF1559 domain-containing protein [Planctomycetes bacterium]|nr:DUF1559 domain-containing protein [Planctomycetota bacterium]
MAANWFLRIDGQSVGPFSAGQLKQKAKSGELAQDGIVRKGESGSWLLASKVEGLFPQLEETTDDANKKSTIEDDDVMGWLGDVPSAPPLPPTPTAFPEPSGGRPLNIGGESNKTILGLTPLVFVIVLLSGLLVACGGVFSLMVLPAVMVAVDQAHIAESKNNMRQIGLATISHSEYYRHVPTEQFLYGEEKPRLSWRVHILPYCDRKDLYDQFKLDEPWDSEHNKKLIAQMPGVYASPTSDVVDEGKTVYLAVTGEDTAFQGDVTMSMIETADGLDNTIMLVEVSDERAVIWTKPDDWEFNPDEPLDGLIGQHPRQFLALTFDGSVHRIPAIIDPELFRRLILYNDGQPVDLDDINR